MYHPLVAKTLGLIDPKDAVQLQVAKNSMKPQSINYCLSVHPSHLYIVRTDKEGQQTLYEFPEGKLLFVKSYDEKTKTAVVERKWKNEKTDRFEMVQTTWTGVPKEWLEVNHDYPEYKKEIAKAQEDIKKSNAAKAQASKPASAQGKGKSKAKKTYTNDFYSLRSVFQPGAWNLVMRTPMMPLFFFGRSDWKHGNLILDHLLPPAEERSNYPASDVKRVEMSAYMLADAWQGNTAELPEGAQDPVSLLFMAQTDIFSLWYAQVLWQTKLTEYRELIEKPALESYNRKLADLEKDRAEGLQEFEAEMKEAKKSAAKVADLRKKIEAKFDAKKQKLEADRPSELSMLQTFEEQYMAETAGITYDFDKEDTGRQNSKNEKIMAKTPKPHTERVKFSARLFRPATDDEKTFFETKRPYLCNAADYPRLEAQLLAMQPEQRRPLCPPTETCRQMWLKHQLVWDGPRFWRAGYVDKAGKPQKQRRLTWKETEEWMRRGAIAYMDIERSIMPDCKMNSAGAKAKITDIIFYLPAPAYVGRRRPAAETDDGIMPGITGEEAPSSGSAGGGPIRIEEDGLDEAMAAVESERERQAAAVQAAVESKAAAAAASPLKRKEAPVDASSPEQPLAKKRKLKVDDDEEEGKAAAAVQVDESD
jgi:hypothetical protein